MNELALLDSHVFDQLTFKVQGEITFRQGKFITVFEEAEGQKTVFYRVGSFYVAGEYDGTRNFIVAFRAYNAKELIFLYPELIFIFSTAHKKYFRTPTQTISDFSPKISGMDHLKLFLQ